MKKAFITLALLAGVGLVQAQIPVDINQLNREYTTLVRQKRVAAKRHNSDVKFDSNMLPATFLYNAALVTGDTSRAVGYDSQSVGKVENVARFKNNAKALAAYIYEDLNRLEGTLQLTYPGSYVCVSCVKDTYVVRYFLNPGVYLLAEDAPTISARVQAYQQLYQKLSMVR